MKKTVQRGRALRLQITLVSLAAAALAVLTPSARAVNVDLGLIEAPATLSITHSNLLGAFTDIYSFTIGDGDSVAFSSRVTAGPGRRSAIPDFGGSLFDAAGGLVEAGIAVSDTLPEGWPFREVTFASVVLGAGAYKLVFGGVGIALTPPLPIGGAYGGELQFVGVTTAVPEPEIAALYALGLVAVGALLRRQRSRVGRPAAGGSSG